MRSFARRGLLSLSVALTGPVVACGGAVAEDPSASNWGALMADGETLPVASGSASSASNRNCNDCATQPLAYWTFDDCNAQTTELADSARATQTTHPAFRAVSTACVAGRWTGAAMIDGATLESGDWAPLTLDLGAVTTSGFDPSKVVLIGVQFYSGFASSGGTFVPNGPAVLEIDSVTD